MRDPSVSVPLSPDVATLLDEIVQMSGGELTREKTAELALKRGLETLSRAVAIRASRSLTACLRCSGQLHGAEADEVTFRGCGACGGIWLDHQSAVRITQKLPEQAIELVRRATSATQAHGSTMTPSSEPLPCPLCRKSMEHHTFDAAEVTVDACGRHGTWYDHGELGQLLDQLLAVRRHHAEQQAVLRGAEIDAEIAQIEGIYRSGRREGFVDGMFWGDVFDLDFF